MIKLEVFIIIFVILIVAYYVTKGFAWYNSDQRKRYKYKESYNKSIGDFDKSARDALLFINDIKEPIAEDHFTAGTILEQNLLQGDFTQAEPRIIKNIFHRYTNTIADAFNGQLRTDINIIPTDLDFMIDHIGQFRNNIHGVRDDLDDMVTAQLFYDMYDRTIPTIKSSTVEDKKNQAKQEATVVGKEKAIDNYFSKSKKYTSQKQSVHDSKVNLDLRNTLKKLKSTMKTIDKEQMMHEIIDYINGPYREEKPAKVADALSVLDSISKSGYISTFNDSEDNILAAVWQRTKHPNNDKNSELMKEAVIDALADGKENSNVVCINGRCAHLLASPVLLDYDNSVGDAKTYEAYKNEMYESANRLLRDKIAEYKESNIGLKRDVGMSYENPKVNADPKMEEEFKKEVRTDIVNMIDGYSDKLSSDERKTILQDCLTAIDV